MSEVIEATVYRFDELSDSAKETARSWYREGSLINDWHEFVYEDFERVCDILGLRLKTRTVRTAAASGNAPVPGSAASGAKATERVLKPSIPIGKRLRAGSGNMRRRRQCFIRSLMRFR